VELAEKDAKRSETDRRTAAKTYADRSRALLQAGREASAQAITRAEKLVSQSPGVATYREQLARNHDKLAELLRKTGQMDEAEKAYRQAIAVWEKLVVDFPGDPNYQRELANLELKLADLLQRAAKPKEAEECYRSELRLLEKLAADYPAEPFYRAEQALGYWLLAMLLGRDPDRAQEAEKAYRQAVAIYEKLVAEFPDDARYRVRLSHRLGELAENLLQQGKHEEAAKAAEKMADVLLSKDSNAYQRAALLLARCMVLADKDAKLSEMDRKAVAQAYADRVRGLMQEAAPGAWTLGWRGTSGRRCDWDPITPRANTTWETYC